MLFNISIEVNVMNLIKVDSSWSNMFFNQIMHTININFLSPKTAQL